MATAANPAARRTGVRAEVAPAGEVRMKEVRVAPAKVRCRPMPTHYESRLTTARSAPVAKSSPAPESAREVILGGRGSRPRTPPPHPGHHRTERFVTTFVLIPGGGGSPGSWKLVADRLRQSGHEAIAVDIQQDDPALGLPEYARVTGAAIANREQSGPVVLAALSFGGFTAPVVAQEHPEVSHIVLLNPMIPNPGERAGAWWEDSGSIAARDESDAAAGRSSDVFDPEVYMYNGLDQEARAVLSAYPDRQPAGTPFSQVCEIEAWPQIATTVLVGADDNFFSPAFQQKIAQERLGVEAEIIDGGHMLPLANPDGVTAALLALASRSN